MTTLARLLVIFGLVVAGLGALILLAERWHLPLGHLPGDIVYHGPKGTVYFPWVTMLVLSALLTLIVSLFRL